MAFDFSLENVELVKSRNFSAKELLEIRKIINFELNIFKNKWHEYFNS